MTFAKECVIIAIGLKYEQSQSTKLRIFNVVINLRYWVTVFDLLTLHFDLGFLIPCYASVKYM